MSDHYTLDVVANEYKAEYAGCGSHQIKLNIDMDKDSIDEVAEQLKQFHWLDVKVRENYCMTCRQTRVPAEGPYGEPGKQCECGWFHNPRRNVMGNDGHMYRVTEPNKP